ncbi:MAG: 4Fe-4S dicluster domain-containing protein [Deltaproteobacteria bacterium]|nr:4Fe-4S dicluster domain-containing protein [Deltaproteobacteria bacterium]
MNKMSQEDILTAPLAETAPSSSPAVGMTGPLAAPRPERRGFWWNILSGLRSLLKGMGVTFRYFSRPSTVVTQQYPENRATLKLFDRSRTLLGMIHDENGFHKCTACHFCEKACPNASITVAERPKPATGKPELDYFTWRMDSCTYCNACVIVCPFSVLTMSGTFENSVFDSRLLIYNLTRYAGPTSQVLMKIADPEERKRMIETRGVFSGVPLLRKGGRK